MFSIIALALVVAPCGRVPSVRGDSIWFSDSTRRSLTASNSQDLLKLEARGARVDSLCITLRIVAHSDVVFEQSWLSTWYFQNDPTDRLSDAHKTNVVIQRLREFLGPDNFETLKTTAAAWNQGDGDDPRDVIAWDLREAAVLDSFRAQNRPAPDPMELSRLVSSRSIDSAHVELVWSDLIRTRPLTFVFNAGGENTRTIAWSHRDRRFVTVFSCC